MEDICTFATPTTIWVTLHSAISGTGVRWYNSRDCRPSQSSNWVSGRSQPRAATSWRSCPKAGRLPGRRFRRFSRPVFPLFSINSTCTRRLRSRPAATSCAHHSGNCRGLANDQLPMGVCWTCGWNSMIWSFSLYAARRKMESPRLDCLAISPYPKWRLLAGFLFFEALAWLGMKRSHLHPINSKIDIFCCLLARGRPLHSWIWAGCWPESSGAQRSWGHPIAAVTRHMTAAAVNPSRVRRLIVMDQDGKSKSSARWPGHLWRSIGVWVMGCCQRSALACSQHWLVSYPCNQWLATAAWDILTWSLRKIDRAEPWSCPFSWSMALNLSHFQLYPSWKQQSCVITKESPLSYCYSPKNRR